MKITRLLNSVKKLNSGIYVPETKVLKPTCNTIATPNSNPNAVITPTEQHVTAADDIYEMIFRNAKSLKINKIYHKKYNILVLNETSFLKAKSIGDGIGSYKNIFSAAFYNNVNRSWGINGKACFPENNIMYNTSMTRFPTVSRFCGSDGKAIQMYERIVYLMPKAASNTDAAEATADAIANEQLEILFSVYPKMLTPFGKIHVMDNCPGKLETSNTTRLHHLISTSAAAGMKPSKRIRFPWGKHKVERHNTVLTFCRYGEEKEEDDDDEDEEELF